MVVGFYDFTKTIHEAKKRLEEEVLEEYKAELRSGLVFEFLKEGRVNFSVEIVPLFKKNTLSFNFRSGYELENDEYLKVVTYFASLFPEFDLLEVELRGEYSFSQTRALEKNFIHFEPSASSYYLANSENGKKLIELLESECLEMNPYKDNFWFRDQGDLFHSFEFHLEIDIEVSPAACLVVRGGEMEAHSLYHHEYYEGNILKKLYSVEEIESFYEELKSIQRGIDEANEPLEAFLKEELDYSVSGYGIELGINYFGMGYQYVNVSESVDYEESFYGMDLEKVKRILAKDMVFVRKAKEFAVKIHEIFERLDYFPREEFRETHSGLMDRFERVEFAFNQYDVVFHIRTEIHANTEKCKEVLSKEEFSLEEFDFLLWDSNSKEQRTVAGKDFLVELEKVVKQDRNKQRIASLF